MDGFEDSAHVVVAIVNWNGKADTLACLESLCHEGYRSKSILVVDNNSSDNSCSEIRVAYPSVEVTEAGTNLGFTGGNNLAIRNAIQRRADFIFLLNNDTTVEPGTIRTLVQAAQRHPEAGALTPLIHYFDRPEEPWFAGSRIDLERGEAVHDNGSPPDREDAPRSIPWASGCAMLIPITVAEQLGGFDDRFFLNWEDVDLSLRTRAAGYQILIVPAARIYHKVGRSFASTWGTGMYYSVRNQLLLTYLHVHQGRAEIYGKIVAKHLRAAAGSILHREPRSLRSLYLLLQAVCDFVRGKFGAKIPSAVFPG